MYFALSDSDISDSIYQPCFRERPPISDFVYDGHCGGNRNGPHLARSLKQAFFGLCVLQLHCSDAAQVEEVAAVLLVGSAALRSLSLRPEFLCLLIQLVVQIVPQQQVQEDFLTALIVPEDRCAVQLQ